MNIETKKLNDAECESVFVLNTWDEASRNRVRGALALGKWVHLDSDCIGHTLAEMVRRDGIRWVEQEYGDAVEFVLRDGWSEIYCHLK